MVEINSVLAKERLTGLQTAIATHTNEYDHVVDDEKKIGEAKVKLAALDKLASSRFLQGNLLNALQQIPVPGVALTRFRIDQSYFLTEYPSSQNNNVHARPSTVTESVTLVLDSRDSSPNPGDQVDKFKDSIAKQSYFKKFLDKTNGISLANPPSAPQNGSDGKPFVTFTLECRFPEVTR